MIKLFSVVAALFIAVAFSSAVIAHTMALPHNHTSGGMLVSQGWVLGVIVACLGFVTLVRTVIKRQ